MNILNQSFSFGSLRSCQPCRAVPIDKFLLQTTHVNCASRLSYRPFSTGRNCRPRLSTPKTRTLLTIALRPRHSGPKQKTYSQAEDFDPAQWQPPSMMMSKVVVGTLVGACVGIFAWSTHLQLDAKQRGTREAYKRWTDFCGHCVMTVRSLQPGQYYTLITSSFMHSSILHLGFCMMGLLSFGRNIAVAYGAPSFLVLYFGSVITGGIFQVKFWEAKSSPNVVNQGVGSSGGVFGLFTAMACIAPRAQVSLLIIPMPILLAAAINVVVTVGGMQGRWLPDLGHADHMGGMAFGVLWAFLAMRKGAPLGRMFRPKY